MPQEPDQEPAFAETASAGSGALEKSGLPGWGIPRIQAKRGLSCSAVAGLGVSQILFLVDL